MVGDARDVGERIERLLAGLRAGQDRETAEELVQLLVELYGEGLRRVVRQLDPALVERLAGDHLVESLLLLHDLHPFDVDTRIRRALDRVRPRLGGVTYLGVDQQGVAHLRLDDAGRGCPSSARSVHGAVQAAVEQAAPELAGVEVAGRPAAEPALLQVGMGPPPGWQAAEPRAATR